MVDIYVTEEQWQQLTEELNRPATEEELKFWREAVERGKKIKRHI